MEESEPVSSEVSGLVFNIQRYCLHDGPGIRTTVFLKGCNLRCLWCENPESILPNSQISFSRAKCIACGRCIKVCGKEAIDLKNRIIVDFELCDNCGNCAEICPSGALEMVGKRMTVASVMDEVMKDESYYRNSGGGVTISGGEPTLQFEFSLAIARALTEAGIHTLMETNGFAPLDRIQKISEFIDLFYLDIKGLDRDKHISNTGQDNQIIHRNARWLVDKGHDLVFRIPRIPGFNDGKNDDEALERFLMDFPAQTRQYIPYHSLGEGKLEGIKTDLKPIGLSG